MEINESDDKDVDDSDYFISIRRFDDNHELPVIIFYSLLIWITYNFLSVWVWMSFEKGIIMRIFIESSLHTYASPTVSPPKEPTDPIKVTNDGNNSELIKLKLNIGLYPVAYDIFTQNLRINVIPVVYDVFKKTYYFICDFCTYYDALCILTVSTVTNKLMDLSRELSCGHIINKRINQRNHPDLGGDSCCF